MINIEFRATYDLVTLLASILSALGAFFLVRSIVLTGSKQISAMASTYIGGNPALRSALVQQKADSVVGFALTFFSGLFWIITVFTSWNLNSINLAILAGFLITILASLLSQIASKAIFKKLKIDVGLISYVSHVQSYLRPHSISQFNPSSLVDDAKRFGLTSILNPALDDFENISNILKIAKCSLEADKVDELRAKSLQTSTTK